MADDTTQAAEAVTTDKNAEPLAQRVAELEAAYTSGDGSAVKTLAEHVATLEAACAELSERIAHAEAATTNLRQRIYGAD